MKPRSYLRNLIYCARYAAATLLLVLVIVLGLQTIHSLYRGEPSPRSTNRIAGIGTVTGCQRVGPVTVNGFGYWWECAVVITLSDGRTVSSTVGPSVVKPSDAGHTVSLVGSCKRRDYSHCIYTREGNYAIGLGVRLLGIVELVVVLFGGLFALWAMLLGLLGARLSACFFGRWIPNADAAKASDARYPLLFREKRRRSISDGNGS